MKFIFDQHVKIVSGFYIGQLARTRRHAMSKEVPPTDPNELPTPPESAYVVELDKFPGIEIYMRERELESVDELPL